MRYRTFVLATASALLLACGTARADPPTAQGNPWGGPPPAGQAGSTVHAPNSALSASHQKLRETGTAGNVPGGGSQNAHFNNGGRSGVREGDDGSEEYTEPEKTAGDYVKEGLGRAWSAIDGAACDADCQKQRDDNRNTERAVAGVRGEANPLDFGTSGGASTNGNGKTVNLGSRGGNDGGRSDQGGSSGVAVANATGQTLNRGNKGGGDALPQGPVQGEQLNGNKLLNGAIDPKANGPH